ncbi:hypothetical protein HCN44_009056 [Aphidius gifuensis]|uniref:Cytochrome c oxidase subunit n=1 Tax=Aphidius gifuensis TaxID=684658 RepID=A0A835CW52_APHGI|nr:cytochrome c oxidase subunit 6A1, mitochondrial-like [Aphidius gifuensis]KAF7996018.1 hypothetical protein HCN44_009056 [Aphidius gifuensis]
MNFAGRLLIKKRPNVRYHSGDPDMKTLFTAEGHGSSEKAVKLWQNMLFFVALPATGLALVNAYLKTKEEERTIKRPEFKPYDHMRIRTKRFPWGDGNHTLFHNPHRNALPDGYEAPEEEHH